MDFGKALNNPYCGDLSRLLDLELRFWNRGEGAVM